MADETRKRALRDASDDSEDDNWIGPNPDDAVVQKKKRGLNILSNLSVIFH